MPHVAKEVLKAIAPSFTDGNASTTVVGVTNVALGVAAGLHSAPCAIFGRSRALVGSNGVNVQTTATAGDSRSEVARHNDPAISALATAKPTDMATMIRGAFYNSPSSEFLTNQVQQSRHSYPLSTTKLFKGIVSQ